MPKLSEKTLEARAAVEKQLAYLDSVAANPNLGNWARLKAQGAANALHKAEEKKRNERLAVTRAKAASKRAVKERAERDAILDDWLPRRGEDLDAYHARVARVRAKDAARPILGRKAWESAGMIE